MKNMNDTYIKLQTNNTFLSHKLEHFSTTAEYIDTNVNILGSKTINQTVENEFIVNYADFQTSGIINGSIDMGKLYETAIQKHGGFEMIYVVKGTSLNQINHTNYQLQKNDIMIMNPNCKSGMISSSDSLIIILTITSEFLAYFYDQSHRLSMFPKVFQDFFLQCFRNSEYKNSDYFIFSNKDESSDGAEVFDCFRQINEELRKKKPGYESIVYGLFCRLLFSITESASYQADRYQIVPQSMEDLTKNIKQYLDTHRYKISGSELSDVFHFHKDYLSKVFQKKMNQTIKKYNQDVCMEEAYNLLCNSQLTISEIAAAVNYSSRSQFYAAFEKTYGMKPSSLRK